MVLICIFLLLNDFSNFSYACRPFAYLLQRNVYSVLLKISLFAFLLLRCRNSLSIWTLTLCHMYGCKYFLPFCRLPFHSFIHEFIKKYLLSTCSVPGTVLDSVGRAVNQAKPLSVFPHGAYFGVWDSRQQQQKVKTAMSGLWRKVRQSIEDKEGSGYAIQDGQRTF